MDSSDFFTWIFGQIDAIGKNIVQSLYTALATDLLPVFWTVCTLFIIWWGYQMMYGKVGLSAGVFAERVGKIALIYVMAFSWGTYSPIVADTLTGAPDSLGTVICQAAATGQDCSASTSMAQSLTQIWTTAEATAAAVTANAGTFGVALMIMGYVILILTGLFLVIASGLLILSKIALYLLLALGPIFIVFAMFEFTSGMFSGWLTSLFQTGIVLPAVVYGILGIMLSLIKTDQVLLLAGTAGGQTPTMKLIGPFVLICSASAYLLLQSQNYAHGIAGGARIEASRMIGNLKSMGVMAVIGGGVGLRKAADAYQNHPNNANSPNAGNRNASIEAAVKAARS